MVDVHLEKPSSQIKINRVGIKDLLYPIKVLRQSGGGSTASELQETVGTFSIMVELPQKYRGTHMSRFIELLEKHREKITAKEIEPILHNLKKTFSSQAAYLKVSFPYFIRVKSPDTGKQSYLDTTATFTGKLKDDNYQFELSVKTPVHLLCPCSKQITEGRVAHNQRAYVTISVRYHKNEFIWIEELAKLSEEKASAPVRALIKRRDEKMMVEHAYQNPRFVEDTARDIVSSLAKDNRITYLKVEVESMESIHNHKAYAMIEKNLKGDN